VIKLEIKAADFKKFEDNLKGIFAKKLSEIEVVSKKSMADMESEATAAAPVGKTNKLRSSINYKEVSKLSYELRADESYAAYVEFGTGPNFKDYPGKSTLWKKLAEEFYVDGSGKTNPHPFFYPTVTKNIQKLKQSIKLILSKNA
jgi:HK97 gp10 family phage protein